MHTVQLDSRIPTSAGQSKRSLHPGRRPSRARAALGGAGSEFGALKPSLKRIKSTSVLAGGPRAPSLAPSRHRRQLRSHPLPRMASFGSDVSLDGLAGGAPHGRPQVRMRPSGADTERRRPAQPKHVVVPAGRCALHECMWCRGWCKRSVPATLLGPRSRAYTVGAVRRIYAFHFQLLYVTRGYSQLRSKTPWVWRYGYERTSRHCHMPICSAQAGFAGSALAAMLLLTVLLAVLHQYMLQLQRAGAA